MFRTLWRICARAAREGKVQPCRQHPVDPVLAMWPLQDARQDAWHTPGDLLTLAKYMLG